MATTHLDTVRHLNVVLKYALTSINQYFLHARMLKHQGLMQLADYEYKASLASMKHADMVVEHILSLGGAPRLQELDKLAIGEVSDDMLKNDLALVENAIAEIGKALAFCADKKDDATTALLNKILSNQQEHMHFIRGQLNADPAAAGYHVSAKPGVPL